MKISIIVPVYNCERWLRDCIDSLIFQKENPCELEILLIDDGSIDMSGKICDEYATEYSNVLAIHTKNQGVSQARNIGLLRSTGEWIMFVDGDDRLHPEAISKLHGEEFFKYDVTRFGAYVFGGRIGTNTPHKPLKVHPIEKDGYIDLIVQRDVSVAIWGGIYAKALITENDIFFEPQIKSGEDWIVLFRIMIHCTKFNYVDDYLYDYRWNMDGATKKKSTKIQMLNDTAEAFRLIQGYANNKNFELKKSSECKAKAIIRKEMMRDALAINTKEVYVNTNELLRNNFPQSFRKDFCSLTKVRHKIVLIMYKILTLFIN